MYTRKNFLRVCCSILLFLSALCPAITVQQNDTDWIITGEKNTVVFHSSDFSIDIDADSVNWALLASDYGDMQVKHDSSYYDIKISQAQQKQISVWQDTVKTGVRIYLQNFTLASITFDMQAEFLICLDNATEDLTFDINIIENQDSVRKCYWPRKFADYETFDFSVIPHRMGMLLPRDWPDQIQLLYDGISNSRGLTMPWWGHQKSAAAVMIIPETPYDVSCEFSHPAGGPTQTSVRWEHSLGRMNYPRRARMCFFKKGDYADMARRYRQYSIDIGRFVSLDEKIADRPVVKNLIGGTWVYTTNIFTHCEPCPTNDCNGEEDILYTYDQMEARLQEFYNAGVRNAYVELDGWGYRGYDNLHPDILPPCPLAGGWERLRLFSERCNEDFKYTMVPHDNYFDYYKDAASYTDSNTVMYEDGTRPDWCVWAGGQASILCPTLTPGYVQSNYQQILNDQGGLSLRGIP